MVLADEGLKLMLEQLDASELPNLRSDQVLYEFASAEQRIVASRRRDDTSALVIKSIAGAGDLLGELCAMADRYKLDLYLYPEEVEITDTQPGEILDDCWRLGFEGKDELVRTQ